MGPSWPVTVAADGWDHTHRSPRDKAQPPRLVGRGGAGADAQPVAGHGLGIGSSRGPPLPPAAAGRRRATRASPVVPPGSTRARPRSRSPSRRARPPARSGSRGAVFLGGRRVGTGDPVLGPPPAQPQARHRRADRLAPDAVSAARSSVHRPVGWPNARGERCSSARSRSAPAASKVGQTGRGREVPATSAATPRASTACRALRTACSPQPSEGVLTSTIWQRCSTKASVEAGRPRGPGAPIRSADARTAELA